MDRIKKAIEEPLAEKNLKLDNVEYIKENNFNILRITIDKDPYVDVDDCVLATKIINPIIDEGDFIKENYILDVCSKEKGGEE